MIYVHYLDQVYEILLIFKFVENDNLYNFFSGWGVTVTEDFYMQIFFLGMICVNFTEIGLTIYPQ